MVSRVNGDIQNPGRICYWEGCWFENGNITQNKLHTVAGNIPKILVEQLQIQFFCFSLAG
jgi:hypothetical protein